MCHTLDVIDIFKSSDSGCFHCIYYITKECGVEGTIALPVYLMKMPFMYPVHFATEQDDEAIPATPEKERKVSQLVCMHISGLFLMS